MNGKTEDSFDPRGKLTVAQLADLSVRELPVVDETVDVPDVSLDESQDAEAILRLYQAGVLTGVDKAGNFNGGGELTRTQAAMMLARVLKPSLRIKAA